MRGEEPFTRPEHHRVHPHAVLVDEVVLDQGLGEVATAVHLDLPARPTLELPDLVDHLAA